MGYVKTFLFAFAVPFMLAADVDLSKYKDYTTAKFTEPVLLETFNSKPAGWTFPREFKIVERDGVYGTSGLMLVRNDVKRNPIARKKVKLEPDTYYEFKVDYRSEMASHPQKIMELSCIRFFNKNGKYFKGAFVAKRPQDNLKDWGTMRLVFQTPPETSYGVVELFMRAGRTGKLWFDNVKIEQLGVPAAVIYPLEPKKLTFDQDGKLLIKAVPDGKTDRKDLKIYAEAGGRKKLLNIGEDGTVEYDFGKFAPGKVDVKLLLLNEKEKAIVARYESPFYSRTADNRITFDKEGFLIENGKRFLPIGIFMGTAETWRDPQALKRVRDAGFNCIQQLGTEFLYVPKQKTYAKRLKLSLDAVHRAGLRYIFAIKNQIPGKGNARDRLDHVSGKVEVGNYVIDLAKDHPAMLAWYCSDENPVTDLPHLVELRNRVSSRDKLHPTLALTEKFGNYPKFAATADILMADIYPVNHDISNPGPRQNMKSCRDGLLLAHKTGIPVWWVPQIFSWSSFRNVDPHRRYPTAEEIRAMILQGTIRGVQGYILYAYHPIFYLSEKKDPGKSKMQWDNVVPSVRLLNDLTPYILSYDKAPSVTVKQISGSMVEARAFRNNGKTVVVITALGPDRSEAEITVEGADDLVSRYGNTVKTGKNKYRFKGLHISSDVLQ